jgi:hypothetical protein
MGIELHIEELVLHGFEAGDRHQIASEVERELARLLGEAGGIQGPRESLAIERMNGGSFNVKSGARPRAAGTQIAQSIYRSLRQYTGASAEAPRVGPGPGGHSA